MTAYPDATPPVGPPAGHPANPGKPGFIRAIASVGLVIGILGLACAPFPPMRMVVGSAEQTNLFIQSPHGVWLIVTAVGGTLLSILLIVASVGCLKLRAWGRLLMILYAVGSLALGIGGSYFYLCWLGFFGDVPAAQRGVIAFIALMGWILGVLYALWALYGMTRPHAKEAFRREMRPVGMPAASTDPR
jgi:hypothetical protein